jgi:hypothetical protein
MAAASPTSEGNFEHLGKIADQRLRRHYARAKAMTIALTPPQWMLDPTQPSRLAWDTIGILLVVYISIRMPYSVAFESQEDDAGYQFWSLNFLMDMFFLVDILINFRTGFYDRGELCMDPALVRRNYLTGYFLIDLVASIPYDMLFALLLTSKANDVQDAPKVLRSAKAFKLARMARILPLLRVMKSLKACRLLSRLEELVHGMWAAFTALVSIMKALLTVLWLGHLQGCLWFLLSSHPAFKVSPEHENWRDLLVSKEPTFADATVEHQYIASVYWSITTMSTVGFGWIGPRNTIERMFAIFTMIVACGSFAVIVGSLQKVLALLAAEKVAHDQLVVRTMRFLRAQEVVEPELRLKVKNYLSFKYNNKPRTEPDAELMDHLSVTLRSEVAIALVMPTLKHFPLFANSSPQFMSRVCGVCTTMSCAPTDVVVDAGTINQAIFFVVIGEVAALQEVERDLKLVARYPISAWFREINLFVPEVLQNMYVSTKFSELLEIVQPKFAKMLDEFPKMKASYTSIQARISAGDRSALAPRPAVIHDGEPSISQSWVQTSVKKIRSSFGVDGSSPLQRSIRKH